MSQTKLVATTGRPTGSAAARRLRTEGHIPGVLYGRGMNPISVTVERRDLRVALSARTPCSRSRSTARATRPW